MSDLYSWRPAPRYEAPPLVWVQAPRRRLWLHVLLFVLTAFTTLAVGARLQYNYLHSRPAFDVETDINPFAGLLANPERLLDGISFSATLLGILLAHELGHYLTCRHYGIFATYPYFIPAPTIIGTMGAFIRIKSPILSRRALFDVGVSGPLAGFLLALPLLAAGIAQSKVVPSMHFWGSINFGNPPLVLLFNSLFHPGVPAANIYLHPMARAAWVGLFATALNLLPAGQLDGGHIVYSLSPRWHRRISRLTVVVLGAPMLVLAFSWVAAPWFRSLRHAAHLVQAYYWQGWFVWAVLLLFLGTRHPRVMDPLPLDNRRRLVALTALLILLLCFTPSPFLSR